MGTGEGREASRDDEKRYSQCKKEADARGESCKIEPECFDMKNGSVE